MPTIPNPGSWHGPCRGRCAHEKCAEMRRAAARTCGRCKEKIGYNTLHIVFAENDVVHESCERKAQGARSEPPQFYYALSPIGSLLGSSVGYLRAAWSETIEEAIEAAKQMWRDRRVNHEIVYIWRGRGNTHTVVATISRELGLSIYKTNEGKVHGV